ncbi:MAG: hypothetical protein JSR82_12780 [Verrucomicrobia bacterium]|nr:hypothetical protein [Verrucomicrobiota bacterium]
MLGLTLLAATSVSAAPSVDEIVAAKATYSGTLKKDGSVDWACTATVKGKGVVLVKWSTGEVTYTGEMGPSGGKAGAPIAMNAKGGDNSEVRFQWDTLDTMQVEWWPNMAAKAGQTQNKPAVVKGTIKKK